MDEANGRLQSALATDPQAREPDAIAGALREATRSQVRAAQAITAATHGEVYGS